MNSILQRDIGKCEGECRDRVREGEEDRQEAINVSPVEDIKSYPGTPWASNRNEPPGVFGGHM